MDNKGNEAFSYTYSAKQQAEINSIRKKYLPKEENKLERLRELDESVAQKASAAALVIGIVGALVMGLGMSCVLVWADRWLITGIIIGSIGIALVSLAYPVYNYTVKKERERIAPEIIRLSDELLK